ncbi:hypothetical protein CAPTEDRAFT_99085, partial [Capitella teleta]
FEFRRSVVFTCQTGYTLSGQTTLASGANGNWSHPKPTCQKIQCPALVAPFHGSFGSVASGNVTYGTVVQYSCQTGYILQGPSNRTCKGTSATCSWTGTQPECARE